MTGGGAKVEADPFDSPARSLSFGTIGCELRSSHTPTNSTKDVDWGASPGPQGEPHEGCPESGSRARVRF